MKRLLLVGLILLMISGCSTKKAWKWIDDADWEPEDKPIRIVDFMIR